MALRSTIRKSNTAIPSQWIGRDGLPLTCEDKIMMLNDYLEEINELSQQAFEEAMQMGCSEEFMRIVLQNMISSLQRNSRKPFSC